MVQNVHSITHPRGRIARAGEPGALWAKDCPCDSPSRLTGLIDASAMPPARPPVCEGCRREWREAMMGESNDTRGGEG